jgi:transcriptional regulator with GAF, ATPase, and Fis domain
MDPKALQKIALEVAAARSLPSVLDEVVRGLSADPDTVLVRIWLIRPGDQCPTCPLRAECPGEVDCLHLVASAGNSSALDGRFRRFPLNVRKVGVIAGRGEARLLCLDRDGTDWLVDPDWAEEEGIRSFAGQPLVFRGDVLGVLALFSRAAFDEEAFGWLRTFADQAAVAIANARALREVERLKEQVELERDYLREAVKVGRTCLGMVGESEALRQVQRQVDLVGPTEASVLITGESGTGKELIANGIHERSARAGRPMVRVNCASIPRELFESEFFGHAKGAFTGALSERAGRFQVASGGTLFLDEVGEIPVELQGKLLRVLQEGKYSRVGEDSVRETDVRVIAATNRDLKKEVADGRFRQDLYYRLGVFPLEVPPLRERREDIPLLAAHFLKLATEELNRPAPALRNRDVRALEAYDWPGNVRELQNVIERAVILSTGGRLAVDLEPSTEERRDGGDRPAAPARVRTEAELREDERANLVAALEAAGWKVSGPGGAAELLDLRPSTLASRMKAMGVRRPGP